MSSFSFALFLLLLLLLLYVLNSSYVHGWCEPFIQCDEGKKNEEEEWNVSSIVFLYGGIDVCLKYRWKKKPFNHSTWLEQIWWTIIIVRSYKYSFEWNHKESKATARTFSLQQQKEERILMSWNMEVFMRFILLLLKASCPNLKAIDLSLHHEWWVLTFPLLFFLYSI